MPQAEVPRAVSGVGGWLDDRFGGARGVRTLMRKVFPDHWTRTGRPKPTATPYGPSQGGER
jgi:hypothetical protein